MSKRGGIGRRISRYLRVDFWEIVLPSPLPNPPDYKPPRKLTWREEWEAARLGFRLYRETWRKPKEADGENNGGERPEETPKEPGLMEEFTLAAKSSANLQPALMKLYRGQMSAFQLSITNFIQGYREGSTKEVDLSSIIANRKPSDVSSNKADSTAESIHEPNNVSAAPATKAGIAKLSSVDLHISTDQMDDRADPVENGPATSRRDGLTAVRLPTENAGQHDVQQNSSTGCPVKGFPLQPVASFPDRTANQSHTATSLEGKGSEAPETAQRTLKAPTAGQPSHRKQLGPIQMPAASSEKELLMQMLLDKKKEELAQVTGMQAEATDSGLLQALNQAEKLAAAALQPGGISQAQRRELEEAVARAEDAINGR